jgi:hypothetical protein
MTEGAKSANSQRVNRCREKKKAAGWRRAPEILMPPSTSTMLDALVEAGYATSRSAAILRAIEDAGKTVLRRADQ